MIYRHRKLKHPLTGSKLQNPFSQSLERNYKKAKTTIFATKIQLFGL
jgi:hypothetical protein